MGYEAVSLQEDDKQVKLQGTTIWCFAKKTVERHSRAGGYRVIGEIAHKVKNERQLPVTAEGEDFAFLRLKTKSRLLYKEAGWLNVGGDEYVVVLKNRLPLLLLLLLALLAAAGAATWLLWGRFVFSLPEQAPAIDPNAAVIEDDNTEKMQSEEGGGAVSLTYSLGTSLSLSTGEISLRFDNPNASNQNVALTFYVLNGSERVKIAESGQLVPGTRLSALQFIQNSAVLAEGEYEGLFLVSFYDESTGEKARVETEITDVKLTVTA